METQIRALKKGSQIVVGTPGRLIDVVKRGALDLSRVGIRGWSFGGYLAALAVLDRPDVFHAAVAGAPVTDWRLYDTHYTERYMGTPENNAEGYRSSSVMAHVGGIRGSLLLVHGLRPGGYWLALFAVEAASACVLCALVAGCARCVVPTRRG